MRIASNTLVCRGMPFIGKVLRQVAPFMDEVLIVASHKSDNATLEAIYKVQKEFPDKVRIDFENVSNVGELTEIRTAMAKATNADWILFLDDDDYWKEEDLKSCLKEIEMADDYTYAFAVNPYQLIDFDHYDISWRNRWFSKFLRNDGLYFAKPFPRDLPMDKWGNPLYWRKNDRVKKLPFRFYHLSYLKYDSFRNDWGKKEFAFKFGEPKRLEETLIL